LTNGGIARAAQATAPRVAQSFLNRQNTFIRRSMFDVHQFLFRSDWTLAASGAAYIRHPAVFQKNLTASVQTLYLINYQMQICGSIVDELSS
jgi:hypothetical protein